MIRNTLSTHVRVRDDATIIDLHGELDGAGEDALNAAYDDAVAHGQPKILLNFSDVEYINSTGIALIVGLIAQARVQGRALKSFGLSDHYREIFEITRMSDFMKLAANEDAAISM